MNFHCPVCLFHALPYPPKDYNICPCCGTEFGNDDADVTHEELRDLWIKSGAKWFYENSPEGWNPWLQLSEGGHPEQVPFRVQAISNPLTTYGEFWFFPAQQALRAS